MASRVLIRVDGSVDKGLGHIYRMKQLSMSLKDAGIAPTFITLNDPYAVPLLGKTGFPCNIFDPGMELSCFSNAVELEKPNIIINDILKTDDSWMDNVISLANVPVLNFDDEGAGLNKASAVINALIHSWKVYEREDVAAKLYEGVGYLIFQESLRKYRDVPYSKREKEFDLVVFFGGTDTRNIANKFVESLESIKEPLKISLVKGPSRICGFGIGEHKLYGHSLSVNAEVPDLFKLLSGAELVLCAGGMSLFEVACLGVPSICVSTEKHEIFNCEYASSLDFSKYAGYHEDLTAEAIGDIICKVYGDKKSLMSMSLAGENTVDCNGLERVVNIVKELL